LVGAQTCLSFITDNITGTRTYIHRVNFAAVDAAVDGAVEGLDAEEKAALEQREQEDTHVPIDLSDYPFERFLHAAGTFGGRRSDKTAAAMCEDENTILAAILGGYADSLQAKLHMTNLDAAKWAVTVAVRTVLRGWLRNYLSRAGKIRLITRGALQPDALPA
jgi:hypothetical protein